MGERKLNNFSARLISSSAERKFGIRGEQVEEREENLRECTQTYMTEGCRSAT